MTNALSRGRLNTLTGSLSGVDGGAAGESGGGSGGSGAGASSEERTGAPLRTRGEEAPDATLLGGGKRRSVGFHVGDVCAPPIGRTAASLERSESDTCSDGQRLAAVCPLPARPSALFRRTTGGEPGGGSQLGSQLELTAGPRLQRQVSERI